MQTVTKFSIYRKPTTTNCIIPFNACHPITHNLAAVRYFNNRLNTHSLLPHDKKNELKTVISIAQIINVT